MLQRSNLSMSGIALAAALIAFGCDQSDKAATPESTKTTASEPAKPAAPIIPVTEMADWCPEHGVPESVCTRCNTSLVAGFKADGDWDEQHNLPKSQCFECDPTLKEKFVAAYKEKYGKLPSAGDDKH